VTVRPPMSVSMSAATTATANTRPTMPSVTNEHGGASCGLENVVHAEVLERRAFPIRASADSVCYALSLCDREREHVRGPLSVSGWGRERRRHVRCARE
jgi:hypothetical protein